MTNRKILMLGAVFACLLALPGQANAQQAIEEQLRAFTPQEVTDEANRVLDKSGHPDIVEMLFTRADLEGMGQFNYIVAGYNALYAASIRVFRLENGILSLVGDLEGTPDVGGGRMEIELTDVDNDGRPEIVVKSLGVSGGGHHLAVFRWTGHSLHLMNVDNSQFGDNFASAEFDDLDGNGILDIVTPSSITSLRDPNNPDPPGFVDSPYLVFKLKNGDYQLAFTSQTDPSGVISADGQNNVAVFARRALLRPGAFSLREIQRSTQHGEQKDSDSEVVLRFGNLSQLAGAHPSVSLVNLKTLRLGRGIRPLSARILPESEDEPDDAAPEQADDRYKKRVLPPSARKFTGSFIEARFSRQALLQYLPHLRFDKPLDPGDKPSVPLQARLKDGTTLHAFANIRILPEERNSGRHQEKKDRD